MKEIGDWALARRGAEEPLLRTKKRGSSVPGTTDEDERFSGITVKRDALRKANHRGGDRHRLPHEVVDVLHNETRQTATLINLSGGGAMIEGAEGLKLWDRVLLQLGECGQVEAAVRWVRGERLGLEFAHETRIDASAEETARMLREVISRSFPDVVAKAEARRQEQASAAAPADESAEADQAEQRNKAERPLRHPLIWSGVIHYCHDSSPVRLRNISQGGVLIQCEQPLEVGAELLLDLDTAGSFFATVNWAQGDAAGLKFHAPFDLQVLASAKPSVAGHRWLMPDYLRESRSASGPWAKQWGRSDLGELHHRLGL